MSAQQWNRVQLLRQINHSLSYAGFVYSGVRLGYGHVPALDALDAAITLLSNVRDALVDDEDGDNCLLSPSGRRVVLVGVSKVNMQAIDVNRISEERNG